MLARLTSLAIVLFWLTMTTLLVRDEVWPDRSALREVPLEHVLKLLWLHQQTSNLTIWNDGLRLGHLQLHPVIRKEDERRLLEYSGNLQLRLPGSAKQRVSWDGVAEFDRASNLHSFLLGLSLREPAATRVEVLVNPRENQARYRLIQNGRAAHEEIYTLDEVGLKKVLAHLDFDPALFDAFRLGPAAALKLSTQQSSLKIHGERIDTYLLSAKQNGQTLFELQVSQLGQVLQLKTLIGYSMAPEDLLP